MKSTSSFLKNLNNSLDFTVWLSDESVFVHVITVKINSCIIFILTKLEIGITWETTE